MEDTIRINFLYAERPASYAGKSYDVEARHPQVVICDSCVQSYEKDNNCNLFPLSAIVDNCAVCAKR